MNTNENKNDNEKSRAELVPSNKTSAEITLSDGTQTASENRKEREKKPFGGGYFALSAALLIAFAVMLTVLVGNGNGALEEPQFELSESAASEKSVIYVRDVEEGGKTTAEIYSECQSSVVSIIAQSASSSGIGSGFVLDESGYIATAAHVIEGADNITVVLSDGKEYAAKVVGSNSFTDLAVLKIEAAGLVAAARGSSESLCAGERVVAIGTPASLDYAGSVCSGEVLYPNRTVKIYGKDGDVEKKMTLIQTDVPVNHGNSGCPLFNSEGEVIGIVTMKLGQYFSGIGFAIPSTPAFDIFDAMIAQKELDQKLLWRVSVPAPRLGISGESAQSDGIRGVKVTNFTIEGCDASQKLKLGDIIIRVGDRAVTTAAELSECINRYSPHDKIAVTVYRDGQKMTFEVVLDN